MLKVGDLVRVAPGNIEAHGFDDVGRVVEVCPFTGDARVRWEVAQPSTWLETDLTKISEKEYNSFFIQ